MSEWSRKPLRVICLNTGQVYRSITSAGKDAGVHASTLMRAIQERRICAGKYWMILPDEITEASMERWRMAQLLGCVGYEMKTEV